MTSSTKPAVTALALCALADLVADVLPPANRQGAQVRIPFLRRLRPSAPERLGTFPGAKAVPVTVASKCESERQRDRGWEVHTQASRRFRSVRRAAAWLAPALALSVLAACGDDTVAAGEPKSEFRDYCAKSLAIENAPEPDIDFESLSPDQVAGETRRYATQLMALAKEVQAAAPAEIRKDIDVLAGALQQVTQTGDFEAAFKTPAVDAAQDRAHAFDLENCKWAKVDVSAKDYSFSGVPKKIKAGPASFEFTNDGKEPHELVLFRVNDGVKGSVKDILALPEGEGRDKVTQMAVAFAEPGKDDYAVVDLKPGRYGVACFVPVGGGEEGPPHVTRGMHAEFEVV